MKLRCDAVTPSVSTRLKFSDEEVKNALIAYAKNEGWIFFFDDDHTRMSFPSLAHYENKREISLVVDCQGTTPGIAKQKDD